MKKSTADRLKEIMKDRNLRQVDILEKTKPFSEKYNVRLGKNDLSQYVAGKVEPSQEKLTILALALNVSEPWLMGYEVAINRGNSSDILNNIDNVVPITKVNRIPILGQIACGSPTWAEENYDGYFIADQTIRADFALKAKGDSMIDAEIYDGDLVFLRKTPDVENGRIAAVLIESEATLKKIVKANNVIILQPCNNDYEPMIVTDDTNVLILGEAVGVYHPYRNK